MFRVWRRRALVVASAAMSGGGGVGFLARSRAREDPFLYRFGLLFQPNCCCSPLVVVVVVSSSIICVRPASQSRPATAATASYYSVRPPVLYVTHTTKLVTISPRAHTSIRPPGHSRRRARGHFLRRVGAPQPPPSTLLRGEENIFTRMSSSQRRDPWLQIARAPRVAACFIRL